MTQPIDYRSDDDDNFRWLDFEHRDGDIVISTRSKHGTTWLQMICALLVFGTTDLPAPLAELSPWLDWRGLPRDDVFDQLAAQSHRRFIKTHTPLDGLPLHPRVTYIVVARHPLDAALSLYHHSANIDRQRLGELTGRTHADQSADRASADSWLRGWIEADPEPADALESLPGVLHHLRDAWSRRSNHDVVMVRYDDLALDLEAQMRALADHLDISVDPTSWPELVAAARFEAMAARADQLAPDPGGILRDRAGFFRQGRRGEAQALLTDSDLACYFERVVALGPPELVGWLHPGR
ncbi:MAG: sulfotransferase domain-containing protein [Acidimicrobiia bacterium]|nr:sulfotransferase domain-containing protein [Acidimicrobiia bacterium]